MRADIVTARDRGRARGLARAGRAVTREDIRAAARLALPHRRRRNPFDAPGLDEELLDQVLGDDDLPDPDPDPTPSRTAARDGPSGPDVGRPRRPAARAGRRDRRPRAPTRDADAAAEPDSRLRPRSSARRRRRPPR